MPLGKQIEKEFNHQAAHLGPEQVKNAFNVNVSSHLCHATLY